MKNVKKMQYALNYSGTRFLSTENLLNFLVDSVLIIFHKVDESGLRLDPFLEETPGGSILVSHYLQ